MIIINATNKPNKYQQRFRINCSRFCCVCTKKVSIKCPSFFDAVQWMEGNHVRKWHAILPGEYFNKSNYIKQQLTRRVMEICNNQIRKIEQEEIEAFTALTQKIENRKPHERIERHKNIMDSLVGN